MLTNLFFAMVGALGVLMMTTAHLWGRTKRNLKRIDRLQSREVEIRYPNFTATLRHQGLAVALAQAELPVSRMEFLRFGALIVALSVTLTYLLTGSVLTPLFMGALSLLLYVQWLFWRRDAHRIAYEEALADLCDRMATGAQLWGTLSGVLQHTAQLAPEIVRADFTQIAAEVSANGSIEEAFERVRTARHSQALNLLLDTLRIWHAHGVTRPLGEVLSPLRVSLRERSAERRKVEAEMTLPRMQMFLIALAPLLFVTLLRFSMPPIAAIYASPLGELIQMLAYSISAAGVVMGERALSRVRGVLEVGGDA